MGRIHNFTNGGTRPTGSTVSQEILERLRISCGEFRNGGIGESGSFEDDHGEIASGPKNTAQAVGYKLTKTDERDNRQEKVTNALYANLRNLSHALGGNREESQKGLVAMGRKLNCTKEEVLTKLNTFCQNRTGKSADGAEGTDGWGESP